MSSKPVELRLLEEWDEHRRFVEAAFKTQEDEKEGPSYSSDREPSLEFWLVLFVTGIIGFLTIFSLGG